MTGDPLVSIRCLVYNHEPFLRQCLDGFVMQKTDFPFFAVVVDDTSTDGEQEVLWTFINNELDPTSLQKDETDDFIRVVAPHKTNKHCFFIFILLKYNHYSIRKAKRPYFKEWEDKTKYIAICEGDDYWADPYKLQKQVDFLEAHPECTLVCNRTKRFSEQQKCFINDCSCIDTDGVLDSKNVIRKGGLYISTCSIVYRKELVENYPDYCKKCHVGDYPLQIMAAMKGNIYYINDSMSVYRVDNNSSWVSKQFLPQFFEKRKNGVLSEVNMLKGFAVDYPKYRVFFYQRIARFINMEFSKWKNNPSALEKLETTFKDDIRHFSLLERLDLIFAKKDKGLLRRIYLGFAWRTYYKLFGS